MSFLVEALASTHDREGFSSGSEPLDRYFRELATQDIKRRVSNCFVARDEDGLVAGYDTFAAASLAPSRPASLFLPIATAIQALKINK